MALAALGSRLLHPRERDLLWFVALSSAWLAFAMPVFSQESYYWTYAQHPDLSYFDHPPMVAWLIAVGTKLFGDGALGIRLGTWLCGMGTVLGGLALLRNFGATARSRCAWLGIAAAAPCLVATRFLANPDPSLVCAWTLTIVALWKARGAGPGGRELGWWLLAGAAAGVALLSKYTAIFLAVGGLLVLLLDPVMRRQWRRPGPYVGVLTAALVFSPVFLWNWNNDFESFRFQTEGRWQKAELGVHWLGQFVGGQLLVLNPAIALVTAGAVFWMLRRRRFDLRLLWLLAFGLPMALFLLCSSLFVQVKINWLVPTAVPLMLGAALWWGEGFVEARPRAARWVARIAAAFALLMLFGPVVNFVPQRKGSTWTGWDEIAAAAEAWEERIDDRDGREGNVFFFAADYKDSAQLGRSLKRHADAAEIDGEITEPTLAQNVFGLPALQFDHWEAPCARGGQHAIFVLPRPEQRSGSLARVRERFDSVEKVQRVHVRRLGIEVLVADIFVCRSYRGPVD